MAVFAYRYCWLTVHHLSTKSCLHRPLGFIGNLVERTFTLDVPESKLAKVHAGNKGFVRADNIQQF